MDQGILVADGKTLIQLMDKAGMTPRAALWVYSSDTDSWKLWVVPDISVGSKEEFYRRLARVISDNRACLPEFDIGKVEYKAADHPVVRGMTSAIRVEGLGQVRMTNNMLNGVYLPDGIVLRMAV